MYADGGDVGAGVRARAAAAMETTITSANASRIIGSEFKAADMPARAARAAVRRRRGVNARLRWL
jgi:hypothetical protein